MISTACVSLSVACSLALFGVSEFTPTIALADEEQLQNVTYRARIDGMARGAQISYLAQNDQRLTADPTMLPGRVFEASTVLPATAQATMDVSVDWPYSANLHCEILVDGVIVAQADDFVAPRLTRPDNDPSYGILTCQAPAADTSPPDSSPLVTQPV